MTVQSAKEFQQFMFSMLDFSPTPGDYYTLYASADHPENGQCCLYSRPGYYELGVAAYTVPTAFSVTFSHPERLLRFGTLYTGKTHFKLQNQPADSFTPSSFLVMEEGIRGQQTWKAGDSFQGMELTVFEPYLTEYLAPSFPELLSFSDFPANITQKALSPEMLAVLSQMYTLHCENRLSPIALESLVLQCLAILTEEIKKKSMEISPKATFQKIKIGTDRYLNITYEDLESISRAKKILTERFCAPPTLQELSKEVLLSEQKLKSAFLNLYGMNIHTYTTSLKMDYAASLLQDPSLSVGEISKMCGYEFPGNFIHAFKKWYGVTPREYR